VKEADYLRNLFLRGKWILKQAKPSALSLLLIISIGIATSILTVYRAVITKQIVDVATTKTQFNHLIFLLIIFIALIIFEIIVNAISSALAVRCSNKISNNIQRTLYSHLLNTRWYEFSKYHSGDIMTRMTSDIEAITSMIVSSIPSIVQLMVMLIASFITLLFYSSTLAILILFLSPLPILFAKIFGKRLKALYIRFQKTESLFRSFLNESVQNIIIIKSFCTEEDSIAKISKIQKNKLDLALKKNRISIIYNSSFSLVTWIGMALALIIGSLNIFKGISTFGTLTATIQLVGSIQGPFAGLAATFPMIISAIGSSERIMEVEGLPSDIKMPISYNINCAGLKIEDVSFSYNEELPILKNISATIHPGEIAAIVGPSGQGKTTLIRLLLSLIKPDSGGIYITDREQNYEVSASSRKLIDYVPQGNTLFSGTIADNIRCGYLEASEQELEIVAKVACAWDFIKDLPKKLNTIVGEHGLGLSEGQAQRIAIARALIHKAPILIFDEATSALDNETEMKILKSIRGLNDNCTCIIITHRPAALEICQRIFKIDNTHLIEIT